MAPTCSAPGASTSSASRSCSGAPPASRSCRSLAPGFDVFTSTKQPAPAAAAASTSGSSESRPSSGLAVKASAPEARHLAERARGGAHERLPVRGGGDRHVAALAVGYDEQAVLARRLAHLGERRPPRRAEPLEAGELQLDGHAGRPRGLDGGAAVARHGRRRALRRGALLFAPALPVATAQPGPGRAPARPGCDAPLRAPQAGPRNASHDRLPSPGVRHRSLACSRTRRSLLPRQARLSIASDLAALDRLLQRRAGGEARHAAGRDLDPLAGLRVHALAGAAVGDRELAEAGEADLPTSLERVSR